MTHDISRANDVNRWVRERNARAVASLRPRPEPETPTTTQTFNENEVIDLENPVKLKKVSHEDALARSIKYFDGDELAATVWINKYALKDSNGNLYEATPDDMHRRMAREIARVEKKYPNPFSEKKIYSIFKAGLAEFRKSPIYIFDINS